tara:strand:- start:3 stop:416 length:414 start_codon:yes stop_codon:yes gene_type:complete
MDEEDVAHADEPYPTPHECCGEVMSYQWSDEGDDPYPTLDDEWVCESCDKTIPSRRYRDWFGKGDTDEELKDYLKHMDMQGHTPLRIFYDCYMVCVVFPDFVSVFGYDGNEYCHAFQFDEATDKIAKQLLSLGIRKG